MIGNGIDMLGPSSVWTRLLLGLGLDVAFKAAGLGLIVLVLHGLLGRRRPLVRSVLWNACLVGLVLLPASAALFPRLRVACLPSDPVSKWEAFEPSNANLPDPSAGGLVPSAPIGTASEVRINPAPRPPFDFGRAIIVTYAVGAGLLLVRLLVSLGAVRALRRSSVTVEAISWRGSLDAWHAKLGLDRAVRLARSDRVDVPLVLGSLRPVIVLPERLVEAAAPKEIDAVLLHELAHIRRGDYAWNLALRVVQAFYWPHPIAWVAGRLIGGVREQSCDELCVYWMGDARDYRASLLAVAAGLVRPRPWQTLGLAMARTSKLGRRIAWIDRAEGSPRCLLLVPARVAIAGVVIATFGVLGTVQLARPATASAQAAPAAETKTAAKPAQDDEARPKQPEPVADEPKEGGGGAPMPKVKVVHPKRADFPLESSQVCSLQTFEPAAVHAQAAGQVVRDGLARVGETVKKGQVLAVIDAPELKADRLKTLSHVKQAEAKQHQAQAAVKVAQATIDGNEARKDEARLAISIAEGSFKAAAKELKRFEQLGKAAVISTEKLDEARNKEFTARGAYEASHQRLKSAQSALDQSLAEREGAEAGLLAAQFALESAQADAARARDREGLQKLLSPIDGVVIKRNVEPDTIVRPGEGVPLFVIARTDIITAVVDLPQNDALLADVGDPVTVSVAGNPSPIEGKIARTAYDFDPKSKTLRVEVDIPNANGRLRPGLSGIARIILETHPNALVLPGSTLFIDSFGRYQCARVVNGQVLFTLVKTTGRANHFQEHEVVEGLKESDAVVDFSNSRPPPRSTGGIGGMGSIMGNPHGLQNGTRVQVVKPGEEDAPPDAGFQ